MFAVQAESGMRQKGGGEGMSPSFRHARMQKNVLLFGVLLVHLGFYMVLPIIPLYLSLHKGFSAPQIGIVLACTSFSFQAFSLIGGLLADRYGRRPLIVWGAWMRGLALAGFGAAEGFGSFVALSLLSGAGVGFNAPSTKAAISDLASTDTEKTSAFSLRGVAANAGMCAAGLITYFLLGGASSYVFYAAGALFAAAGALARVYLPKRIGVAGKNAARPAVRQARIPFAVFAASLALIWALYAQFALAVPLRASAVLGDPDAVSLIWTFNSLAVILLQTPISRWVLERTHPLSSLGIGVWLLGVGLGSLHWAHSFGMLALCGLLFVAGEMMIMPSSDTAVSKFAGTANGGLLFGLANFVSGMGEGLGNLAGGRLLETDVLSTVPWAVYAGASLLLGTWMMTLRRWRPLGALWAEEGSAPEAVRIARDAGTGKRRVRAPEADGVRASDGTPADDTAGMPAADKMAKTLMERLAEGWKSAADFLARGGRKGGAR
jgi:MFS family permease